MITYRKGGVCVLEELISLIPNVGFPIVITIYLLVRFDGMIKSMLLSQKEMIMTIEKLCGKINDNY